MSPVSLPANRLLVAALSLLLTRLSCSSLSVPDIPHIAAYFGTKTRYEEVNPHLLRDVFSVNASVLKPPPTERCSPVHLTAVIRHGSRYPTVKNIRRIQKLSELVRREASRGSAEGWLQDIQSRWEMWYTEDMDGQLVMKGREDLRQLAGRLSVLFPSLLSEENLRRISFLSSSKHRCVSSVEAFQEGLQRRWGRSEVEYGHEVDDELMRFFERCRGYVEGVEKNRTALQEVEKFKHGEEMEGVRRRTAERLGLPHHRLTPDLVEAAFFLCSYELSIKSLHSPWCFLFDESDAKVLEYKSDLKQYWKRSHGHVISSLSSCPLFHHVFRTLDKAGRPRRATEASPEPASILVGHAETLLPLLSLLGLYKDKTPPTASNYHSQHSKKPRPRPDVQSETRMRQLFFRFGNGRVLQEGVSGPARLFHTPPTSSSFCTTASEAPGCSCLSTRPRFDSQGWSLRMPRCTGTSGPRTATCWTAATSTGSARGGPVAGRQTPNSERKWWFNGSDGRISATCHSSGWKQDFTHVLL